MKRMILSTATALGLIFSVAAAQAETVKIAFAGPMTGSVKQYGDMVREGFDTAIELINAAGGVNGMKFEAVYYDDACEPKQAVAVANKIVSDEVGFVIGHVCSGSTIPAADVYDNEGIVMITSSASAPALTDAKQRTSIFRTMGRDDQQSPAAAKYIIEKIKPQKVAVLHDKQSYGQGVAVAVKDELDKNNVNVAILEGINVGESDYSAVITKMKAAGIDFVYFGGYHPEMGLLLRQAKEQGFNAGFMGTEGIANNQLAAVAGPAAEGVYMTQAANFAHDPSNAELVKTFKDKGRDASGAYQLQTYTAVKVIADSINALKSTDPEKVAEYIHANSFDTPIGKISYDEKGDLKIFTYDILRANKDGSRTLAP